MLQIEEGMTCLFIDLLTREVFACLYMCVFVYLYLLKWL